MSLGHPDATVSGRGEARPLGSPFGIRVLQRLGHCPGSLLSSPRTGSTGVALGDGIPGVFPARCAASFPTRPDVPLRVAYASRSSRGSVDPQLLGAPERIRTSGLLLRRPTLYPPELQAHVRKSTDLRDASQLHDRLLCPKLCPRAVINLQTATPLTL